jgi:hypothetical protein
VRYEYEAYYVYTYTSTLSDFYSKRRKRNAEKVEMHILKERFAVCGGMIGFLHSLRNAFIGGQGLGFGLGDGR